MRAYFGQLKHDANAFQAKFTYSLKLMKENVHCGAFLWSASVLFTIGLILISCKFLLTFAFHYNIS